MALTINKEEIAAYLEDYFSRPAAPIYAEGIARCYYWLQMRDKAKTWFQHTGYFILDVAGNRDFKANRSPCSMGKNYLKAANMLIKGEKRAEGLDLLGQALENFRECLLAQPGETEIWGCIVESNFLMDNHQEVMKGLAKIRQLNREPYPRYEVLGFLTRAQMDKDKDEALGALDLLEKNIEQEGVKPFHPGDTYSLWDRYEAGIEILSKLDPSQGRKYKTNLYDQRVVLSAV